MAGVGESMHRRLQKVLDALERFLVRKIRTQFDELVFVIASVAAMMWLALLGNAVAGRVGMGLGSGLVVLLGGLCGTLLHRGHVRELQESQTPERRNQEKRDRLPYDYLLSGVLLLAISAPLMFGAEYYPSLFPPDGIDKGGWLMIKLIFALAPGPVLVGMAGFLDERICFAVSEQARGIPLPFWTYVAGWTLLLGGFAAGGYLAFLMSL